MVNEPNVLSAAKEHLAKLKREMAKSKSQQIPIGYKKKKKTKGRPISPRLTTLEDEGLNISELLKDDIVF